MRKQTLRWTILASLVSVTPALAAQVTVSDAWFRALPANLPAGGYFTLHNNGAALKLTGADSPVCGVLMLHKSNVADGMATMSMVESIDIATGGTLIFGPGNYHLMCMSPTAAMRPGASVPVTLQFAGGLSTTAKFVVRNAAGK